MPQALASSTFEFIGSNLLIKHINVGRDDSDEIKKMKLRPFQVKSIWYVASWKLVTVPIKNLILIEFNKIYCSEEKFAVLVINVDG